MKTKINSNALFVIGCLFFTLSCKKESNIEKPPGNLTTLNEKVKSWYDNQNSSLAKKRNEYLLWKETRQIESGINITPIKIGDIEIGDNNKVYKILLTKENEKGDIISGSYIYYVPNGNSQNLQIQEMNLLVASKTSTQNKFSGAVLKYEINYKLIEAKTYYNGQIEYDQVKLISKSDGKSNEISSFAEIPCGVCIDWYLQTYDIDTGEILSEIYLFTECGHNGCEGGGGGGNGGSVPQSVYNGLMTLVNSIVVSNETKSITTLSETPEQKIKKLEWKLLKGIGWYIYSWEKGTQVKVASQDRSTQWQWHSITHEGSAKVGVIVRGSVSHNITYWNAILGLYNAIVDVQLSVTCSVGWRGSPISYDLTYSCQKNFNVNESYE